MPVPSSYNDITEDYDLREHVGTVWYDRKFFLPASWSQNKLVWIRFGSVHYEAFVVCIFDFILFFFSSLSLSSMYIFDSINAMNMGI